MLHHLSWNRVPETNTLSVPFLWTTLMDVSVFLEPVQVPTGFQTSKMLCFTKAAHSSCHQIWALHLCREKKIHFKSPHLLILKPALGLYLLSTWAYSLINWNKYTSSSDIYKGIGQPIYYGKYMLSHLFLYLIIHLPPLPGIISVENTSYSLFITHPIFLGWATSQLIMGQFQTQTNPSLGTCVAALVSSICPAVGAALSAA